MMRLITGSILLCLGLTAFEAQARPDEACDGRWSIELVKDKYYASRRSELQDLIYPVDLKLSSSNSGRVTFTGNRGRECYRGYVTDEANDFVVFMNCSETYSDTIPVHYKMRCKDDVMTGKIVSYKDLFNIKGTRVKK